MTTLYDKRKYRNVTPGATAFPRFEPRPEYPPWYDVLLDFFMGVVRAPLIVSIVAYFCHPIIYLPFVRSLRSYGVPDAFIFGIQTLATHHTIWMAVNSFFFSIWKFGLFRQYRLGEFPSGNPTDELVSETLWALVPGTPAICLGAAFGYHVLFQPLGMPDFETPLPPVWKIFLVINYCRLGSTIIFGVVHRIIHAPSLYKLVHAKHHSYVNTISIASEWANPIEGLGQILVPAFGGVHPFLWTAFLCWEISTASETHSGYAFAGTFLHSIGLTNADASANHHWHHIAYDKGNFTQPWLDWLWGTKDAWYAMCGRDTPADFYCADLKNIIAKINQERADKKSAREAKKADVASSSPKVAGVDSPKRKRRSVSRDQK